MRCDWDSRESVACFWARELRLYASFGLVQVLACSDRLIREFIISRACPLVRAGTVSQCQLHTKYSYHCIISEAVFGATVNRPTP
jgi:hypothetical protein